MKKPRHLVKIGPVIDVIPLEEPITMVDCKNEIIPGMNGITFIPSVSSEGIISWTNNGDLPNPEPINIKGTPTIVNGKTGESITLTAEDVGALSSTDFDLIDCGTSTEVI